MVGRAGRAAAGVIPGVGRLAGRFSIARRFPRWLTGPALWLAALLALGACDSPPTISSVVPGAALPRFVLPAINGPLVSSSDWRGRPVVLNFWATWCAPCRAEMPDLQWLAARFAGTDLLVVGISVDRDLNLVREFLRRHDIGFANLSDADMAVANGTFALAGYPVTFIVARDGRVREVVAGPRPWGGDEMAARLVRDLAPRPVAVR